MKKVSVVFFCVCASMFIFCGYYSSISLIAATSSGRIEQLKEFDSVTVRIFKGSLLWNNSDAAATAPATEFYLVKRSNKTVLIGSVSAGRVTYQEGIWQEEPSGIVFVFDNGSVEYQTAMTDGSAMSGKCENLANGAIGAWSAVELYEITEKKLREEILVTPIRQPQLRTRSR